MKVISKKDGDLLSQFGNINGNDIPIPSRITDLPPQTRSTPNQKVLIDNLIDASKVELKDIYILKISSDFAEDFKR